MRKVLVIKHGALGDVILALGPLAAIRAHHPDAQITLLTTAPFADFLMASPYIDRIWIDSRPRWWQFSSVFALCRQLRSENWAMVYDLQTSARSSRYFYLASRPPWSGIAAGCAYPHRNPQRDFMHSIERQAEQLADAGIAQTPPTDLSWIEAAAPGGTPAHGKLALLVPGGSAHRPEKRWPLASYAELATALSARHMRPVLIGTRGEAALAASIQAKCPDALDLTGRTDLFQLVALARRAHVCVGNDTGPMHLFAAAGLPALVLFSAASDPALCAPRGPAVHILRRDPLAALSSAELLAALDDFT